MSRHIFREYRVPTDRENNGKLNKIPGLEKSGNQKSFTNQNKIMEFNKENPGNLPYDCGM